jgi:CRISPR system Cascade subunit CasA
MKPSMTQPYSFNLVDEPWLPCLGRDGRAAPLSLRRALTQAHALPLLAGDSPPQTAALHRFLLAVLHRLFGPADYDAWGRLWEAGAFDAAAIDAYLNRWRHRFDLFNDARPFYQSATLYLDSQWVSIDRLSHELNAAYPLFNHAENLVKDYLTPADAVRALITAQNFSLGGTSGAFFPRNSPGAKLVQSMFTDCPIARAVNFLIEGASLFETLMLNLIQYPDEEIIPAGGDDAPVWELDDPSGPERGPLRGYLDYLTWQNRRILLRPEADERGNVIVRRMRWEPAGRLDLTPRDPMQHHVKNEKEGFRSLYFNADKGLWRDSAALFQLHKADGSPAVHFPPATFKWLKELLEERVTDLRAVQICQFMALGMSSKPGQATVYFYRQERMPLSLAYFQDPTLVYALQTALARTEELSRSLRFAIQKVGIQLLVSDADDKKWGELSANAKGEIENWVAHTGAERQYWADLDAPFQSFIVELTRETEAALSQWYDRLRRAALDAFEQAGEFAGDDGRALKAIVRGRGYLIYRLNELLPRPEEPV